MSHHPIYGRITPRYWQSRFWLVVMVLQAMVIMGTAPNSLSYVAIEASGPAGWYWITLLAGLALFAVADLVVNDWMPEGFCLPTAERRRYLVYVALAMGLVSICGAIVAAVGWTSLLLFYLSLAAWSVQIAVTDLMHYHRMRMEPAPMMQLS